MSALLAPLQTDPWSPRFIDVERLNGHASALFSARLAEVRDAALAGQLLPTTSIAVLGAAGAGKTHIFARLRRTVGGRASFALVRPLLGAEPTLRLLLAELMDQLRRPSFGGSLPQLESLVGGALATGAAFPSAGLTDASFMDREERTARIDETLARLFQLRPELEGITDYIRRLLELPFERREDRAVLSAWLSGRDIDPEAARGAGLPGPLSDVNVLRALTALAAIASSGAPLLVAFDQLENLADASGDRVRAHGNLVAELVDQVPALTLVQLALTGEWLQHIHPSLSLPQRSRVAEQTVLLDEPTVDDRRHLVRAWLEGLPGGAGARRALPDGDVERWCCEPGMTPRMLLQACRRALEDPGEVIAAQAPAVPIALPPEPASSSEPARERSARPRATRSTPKDAGRLDSALARAWKSEVRDARRELRDARGEGRLLDVERLAEVLSVSVSQDEGTALVWRRSSGSSPVLVGTIVSGNVRGNVVLVQGNHPRSVATALERARDLASEPLLFARQGSFEFPATWREVAARVTELQGLTRTCWLSLSDDVLVHGLAFASMLAAARSGELTGPTGEPITPLALRAWSSAALGGSVNPLKEELRRVVAGWQSGEASEEPLAQRDATPAAHANVGRSEPPHTSERPSPSALGLLGSALGRAAARLPWSEGPLRWLRAARDQARQARVRRPE